MKTAYETWARCANHYGKLAGTYTNASSKLACLVLADYCTYEWSKDRGGPSLEMVQLAENILGVSLDKMINDLTAKTLLQTPEPQMKSSAQLENEIARIVAVGSSCEAARTAALEVLAKPAKADIEVGQFVAWESPTTGITYKGRVQEREKIEGKSLLRIKVAGAPVDVTMPESACRVLEKKTRP